MSSDLPAGGIPIQVQCTHTTHFSMPCSELFVPNLMIGQGLTSVNFSVPVPPSNASTPPLGVHASFSATSPNATGSVGGGFQATR